VNKARKIKFVVRKEDIGYSATSEVGNTFIGTEGSTYDNLVSNVFRGHKPCTRK
jgi:hypothetical protein